MFAASDKLVRAVQMERGILFASSLFQFGDTLGAHGSVEVKALRCMSKSPGSRTIEVNDYLQFT
jgi:hypothetical protein